MKRMEGQDVFGYKIHTTLVVKNNSHENATGPISRPLVQDVVPATPNAQGKEMASGKQWEQREQAKQSGDMSKDQKDIENEKAGAHGKNSQSMQGNKTVEEHSKKQQKQPQQQQKQPRWQQKQRQKQQRQQQQQLQQQRWQESGAYGSPVPIVDGPSGNFDPKMFCEIANGKTFYCNPRLAF